MNQHPCFQDASIHGCLAKGEGGKCFPIVGAEGGWTNEWTCGCNLATGFECKSGDCMATGCQTVDCGPEGNEQQFQCQSGCEQASTFQCESGCDKLFSDARQPDADVTTGCYPATHVPTTCSDKYDDGTLQPPAQLAPWNGCASMKDFCASSEPIQIGCANTCGTCKCEPVSRSQTCGVTTAPTPAPTKTQCFDDPTALILIAEEEEGSMGSDAMRYLDLITNRFDQPGNAPRTDFQGCAQEKANLGGTCSAELQAGCLETCLDWVGNGGYAIELAWEGGWLRFAVPVGSNIFKPTERDPFMEIEDVTTSVVFTSQSGSIDSQAEKNNRLEGHRATFCNGCQIGDNLRYGGSCWAVVPEYDVLDEDRECGCNGAVSNGGTSGQGFYYGGEVRYTDTEQIEREMAWRANGMTGEYGNKCNSFEGGFASYEMVGVQKGNHPSQGLKISICNNVNFTKPT